MSLTNPTNVVTEQRLAEFYQAIFPYLGGDSYGGGHAPIGTVIAYMGNTAPNDYLVCDGTVYNITDYKQLADFFEDQFGSKNHFGGDGTTTFAVPDLRGEFLRGTGTNSHTDQGNGENVGVHQNATEGTFVQVDRINDSVFIGISNNINNTWTSANYDSLPKRTSPRTIYSLNRTKNTDQYSSDTPYTSRPTNTSVLYCIKAVCAGEVYSTTERKIGTWVDGKPLYQKTINIGHNYGTVSSNVRPINYTIPQSMNVDKVISCTGYDMHGRTLPYMNQTIEYSEYLYCSDEENYIYLRTGSGLSYDEDVYVTIQYTKTTD